MLKLDRKKVCADAFISDSKLIHPVDKENCRYARSNSVPSYSCTNWEDHLKIICGDVFVPEEKWMPLLWLKKIFLCVILEDYWVILENITNVESDI